MDKQRLTAPCGLDCFNCPTYEGNIDITGEWAVQTAEFLKIPVDELPCKGCRDEKGHCKFAPNKECATWECVQEKGVSFCHECVYFPCELLMPTKQGANYPHNMKVYNLSRMKLIGLDKWIEESSCIRERYYNGTFLVGQGPVLKE
ncbi:MAG: DUF3795 domain-containing protein [Defluviitaleaceae bacterium]|nr:DUF3795 domain-containing protein [Defluviitaleaceae bacterium]MCL2836226.1 DUF3795 domain-containing protein [Defluviitaleaceae bacterium]